MKRFVLSVLAFHFSLSIFSQNCTSLRYQDTIFHAVTVTSGVKFGTATPYGLLALPQDLYFDFYEPAGDTLTKRPLIIFQFGGGFTIGWRSEPVIPQFCDYFAKCGYAVASIDYRIGLNPADTNSTIRAYYRGVQDERSAIRYLCQRAQQYKFDTSLIILTGTSAGCFCAFANTFTTDADRPASSYGSLLEPADLGCMDCSGNNDFGHHIPRIKAIVNQWGAIMDTSFIQSGENTPVISFHGDQDNLVPYVYGYPFNLPVFPPVYGSVPVHQRLTNLGIQNVLHPLVGFGHEPELLNPQLNDTIYNYTRPFLFDLLKPNTSDIMGDSVVCGNTVAHYSVANTSGSKYCWSVIGNGTIISNTGNSIAVMWNDTGIVSVRVKELNYIMAEGEEKIFQTQIVPHAVVSNFNLSVNELEISFDNLSTGATNFNWNFGDGLSSADFIPPTKQYESGGSYTVTLIANNNFCADTFLRTISIDSCPVAEITYQLNNRNVFFYTPNTNTISYSWNFGDGDSASVNFPNVFHQYQQNGEYTIILNVKNQLGCEETDTLIVNVFVSSIDEIDKEISVIYDGRNLKVYGLQSGNYTVELFDVLGRRIIHEVLLSDSRQLPLVNLIFGMYILKISDGENVYLKKFTSRY